MVQRNTPPTRDELLAADVESDAAQPGELRCDLDDLAADNDSKPTDKTASNGSSWDGARATYYQFFVRVQQCCD